MSVMQINIKSGETLSDIDTGNDYNSVIDSLQNYMLTGKMLSQNMRHFMRCNMKSKTVDNETVVEKEKKQAPKQEMFLPTQVDQLFWCFYIIQNGFSAYEYPGNTSFVHEKSEKIRLIEFLRTKKSDIKRFKIKKIMDTLEEELANNDKISVKTFLALCIAHNKNILFVHRCKCFQLTCNEHESYHCIHYREDPTRYYYAGMVTEEKFTQYTTMYYKWEDIDKTIKGVSTYKLDDLTKIYEKLGAIDNKYKDFINAQKRTKNELYEYLIQHL